MANAPDLIYAIVTIVVPLIGYLSSRNKAPKKDVQKVSDGVTSLLNEINTLRQIDDKQQAEIDRLRKIKKIDADRMHTLHEIIRKKGGE